MTTTGWRSLLMDARPPARRWPGSLGRARAGRNPAGRGRADEIDKLISATGPQDNRCPRPSTTLRAAGRGRRRQGHTGRGAADDPQLLARGFWETVDHPVAGAFLCTGMPFAFVGRPRRWIRRAPPLYGQHTDEVLTGVLGHSRDDLAALRQPGAISDRPAGL